jgi:hydrogenase maturation protease
MLSGTEIGGSLENPFETLILGLGNILWADEGFGVRAVEALNAAYRFPDNVRLMDGGTQGIFLLPWVRAAEQLLILDAIDWPMNSLTRSLSSESSRSCSTTMAAACGRL